MKRILFFMNTSSQIGGVETWLDRVNAHLTLHGFEPIVGLVRGMRYNDPTRYKAHHPDLRTVEVDGRGLNREGRVRALMRCIRDLRPDIVLPLGIVDANEAVIRRKLAGDVVRLVGRAQGNLAPMLADLRTYREWMDKVICPGRLTQRMLIEWAKYPAERVLNIANGADDPTANHVARSAGQPLRIGYVGRLTQQDKRVLDLAPLCQELTRLGVDFRLEVVGDGPCMADLKAGLAGFDSRVCFHGALSHAELYERIFPKLDALIMTSASEAFGIVLVEAMMNGVVPVSSRYHGFHSEQLVVEEGTGLSFEVGDMPAAAVALKRLADDPATLDILSTGALAHAQNFTWDASLSRWVQTLGDLAEAAPVVGGSIPNVAEEGSQSRLDRLGAPPALTDWLRRIRRAALGPAVAPGGVEWPLFYRSHSRAELEAIDTELLRLDSAGAAGA